MTDEAKLATDEEIAEMVTCAVAMVACNAQRVLARAAEHDAETGKEESNG